jgi:hypothetical protein
MAHILHRRPACEFPMPRRVSTTDGPRALKSCSSAYSSLVRSCSLPLARCLGDRFELAASYGPDPRTTLRVDHRPLTDTATSAPAPTSPSFARERGAVSGRARSPNPPSARPLTYPIPSPVMSARDVSPKQMNAAHANGTHGRICFRSSNPTRLALPARATTCAITNRSSGSSPYT